MQFRWDGDGDLGTGWGEDWDVILDVGISFRCFLCLFGDSGRFVLSDSCLGVFYGVGCIRCSTRLFALVYLQVMVGDGPVRIGRRGLRV